MLRINDVYELDEKKYRILKVYTDHIIWIELENQKALPELYTRSTLIEAIESGNIKITTDPFEDISLMVLEENSVYQIKRDKNLAIIKPIIEHEKFYDSNIRASLINEIVNQKITTKQTIYRLLRQYWQRGMTPNTLIPQYYNSGGKGVKKAVNNKKLGRPRIISEGTGALIDEDIERLFRRVINQYMLNENKHTLPYTYRKFLSIYQSLYPDIIETEVPSIWQLKYFYDREYSPILKIKSRTSKIEYLKDKRVLYSTVNTHVLGPGSRYQVDATIADIYLVSDSDRGCIIGRPTIYFMMDEFSRMVTGMYVGLENPSYVTSMLVLRMAMSDKVDYCKKFDHEITFNDWPCIGLPEAILADRAELLGHQIENLEKNFAIRIENTPAYRGDLKSIVERYFRTIQAEFKPYAPGVVQAIKEKKRGGKDYRLDATLTVKEFTQIILNSVLIYNNTHELSSYDRDIDMPTDLPCIPIHLWNWGIQNRTGKLRSASEKAIYIALLPRTDGTLSELGLKVFGVFYNCKELIERGLLHRKSASRQRPKLKVAYDPANAEKVYIFHSEDHSDYWEAQLSNRSREFRGCSFWEVWQVQLEQKITRSRYKINANLARADLEQRNEDIIEKAISSRSSTQKSNAQRLSSIRNNRNQARTEEREDLKKSTQIQSSQNAKVRDNIIPISGIKKAEDEESTLLLPTYYESLFDEDDD